MKAKILFLTILVSISSFAQTNNVIPRLKVGERIYTNAQISSASATEAIVRFDGGGARVNLEDLPEPYRSKYFDPEKAKAAKISAARKFAEKKELEEASRKAALENWKREHVRIVDGKEINIANMIKLEGEIDQVIPNDGAVILRLYESHQEMASPAYGSVTSGNFLGGGKARYRTVTKPGDKCVFVKMNIANLTDGDALEVSAVKGKPITKTNVLGAVVTMDFYTTGLPYK
jgi:hypothetical protein